MPFNGSGTFVPLSPPDFPALPFTTILASQFNNNLNDVFTNGLTDCMTRDGQSPPTANIPMAGFRLTGLGPGTNGTDAAQLQQTLATLGQVGVVDWNTRITNGIFEATAASLTTPATNFPPTSSLGQLTVIAQGALVDQIYKTAGNFYYRQKVGGTFTPWSQPAGRRNFFINGSFNVWQDNTGFVAGVGARYSADMVLNSSTGTTSTANRIPVPVGDTSLPSGARYFYETVISSVAGASNFANTQFLIEDANTLNGRVVTVSFWARTSSSLPVSVDILQNFGSGGSPSTQVSTPLGSQTVGATFARYSFTATLASTLGKTKGTAGDYVAVRVWFDAGTTFNTETTSLGQHSGTYDIFGLKIQEGSVADNFEVTDTTDDLNMCRRYFIREGSQVIFWLGSIVNTVSYAANHSFPVQMRAVPTVVTANTNLSGLNTANVSVVATTEDVQVTKLANATASVGVMGLSYTASARY